MLRSFTANGCRDFLAPGQEGHSRHVGRGIRTSLPLRRATRDLAATPKSLEGGETIPVNLLPVLDRSTVAKGYTRAVSSLSTFTPLRRSREQRRALLLTLPKSGCSCA